MSSTNLRTNQPQNELLSVWQTDPKRRRNTNVSRSDRPFRDKNRNQVPFLKRLEFMRGQEQLIKLERVA